MIAEKVLLSLCLVSMFALEPKFSFPVGDDDDAVNDNAFNEVDSVFNETKLLELDLFEEENNGEDFNCSCRHCSTTRAI